MNSAGGLEHRFGAALIASLVLHAAAMTFSLPAPRLAAFEEPAPPLQVRLAELQPLSPRAAETKALPAPLTPRPGSPRMAEAKVRPAPVAPRPRPRTTPNQMQVPEVLQAPEPMTLLQGVTEPGTVPVAEPAVQATASSPAAPVSVAESAELLVGYGKTISQTLARYKEYPRLAQMRGWEGAVTMELRVSPSGGVLEVKLHSSSGYSVLDDQALEMAARAQRFPAPPEGLRDGELAVRVPIVFRLTP